jgi:two-component system sensor histidine kinase/response regulator
MADAHTPLDREVRAALVREARERIQSEGPIAEIGHLAVAAVVVLLVIGSVPRALLVGWCAVMVAATLYRYNVRLRIRARGYDGASRLAFLLTVGTVAVTWGLGAALFAQWLPFEDVALLLVILSGLLAAATATLAADRLGFRIFLLGTVLPPIVGIAAVELGRTRLLAILLIVTYGAAMFILHERAHRALLERLATHVRLAASESREARERAYRDALFDSAPVAIVVADEQGIVRDANPGFEALFGWTAAEARGRALNDLLVPSGEVGRAEQLDQSVRSGKPVTIEVERRHKDGRLVPVRASAARVEGAPAGGGEGAGELFVMYEDMAEELRARRALEEAKNAAERVAQMRSAFLANMSHEIRTPMNAVLGLTELLLDGELAAEQRRSLTLIQTAGESLLTLLNDILDLSKIEAESLQLESIPFDLWRLVDQIVSLLAIRAREKGVELATDIDAAVPEQVRGDPTRLRQVLTNLIGNAVKFTQEGEVTVSLSAAPAEGGRARIRFAVRDTGIGIPAEQLAAIFQPYSQADATTARRFGGTGLGLSIARRLVGMMGGTLEVASEVNQGSEFSFTIELPVEAAAPFPLPGAGAVPLEGLTMLVVDDNESNRRIVREMLGTAGVAVEEAPEAEAALAALHKATAAGRPHALAILDAQMPGRDGFELAAAIRGDAALGKTRLMMLTSAAQRGDAQRCRERGIHGYLAKPVSRSDLLDIVAGVLAAAETEGGEVEVVTRHRIHESRRRLKILVADDTPVNREVASTMLRKRGYEVDVVENGRLAVERVAQTRYDIVLMDIEMPELNGYQAAERIRALPDCTNLPVVALTGRVSADERERCLAHGMNAYLAKPFKAFELFTTVEGWGMRADSAPGGARRSSGAPAPMDLDTFRRQMAQAGAGEAVDGIIASFRETLAESAQEIAVAVAAGDAPKVARLAHSLKSSAAQLGAARLAGLLKELEEAAKAAPAGDLGEIHGRLAGEVAEVETYLGRA